MEIYTNSNKKGDFFKIALNTYAKNIEIYIAVPFLTEIKFIQSIIKRGCRLRIIFRLCYLNNPAMLRELIKSPHIDVRYYTSEKFHSKLYIFGEKIAYIGSSNLTDSGLISNQEINISILSENPIFEELQTLFIDYWENAEVLNDEVINKFEQIRDNVSIATDKFHKDLINKLGEVSFPGVFLTNKKRNSKNLFVSNFLKEYQEYINSFKLLQEIYNNIGKRKDVSLPLRIEIDRFLSWIRLNYAKGETYLNVPIKSIDSIKTQVEPLILKYIETYDSHFDETVRTKFPLLSKNFSSGESINSLSSEEIYDTLMYVNAFHDQFRFFPYGYETMKEIFLSSNSQIKLKKMLTYLLYGSGEYYQRVANTIFDSEYKLYKFSKSCVKELFGLINSEDIPTCNDRLLRSMQWLGFRKFF